MDYIVIMHYGMNENIQSDIFDKLVFIIGEEKIQQYNENDDIEGLRNLLIKNLSQKEYDELENIAEGIYRNKDDDYRNSIELLEKLCKNMGQENLVDYIRLINGKRYYDKEDRFFSLDYRDKELICYYDNYDITLKEYKLDREKLLKMDPDSLCNYLNEIALNEKEKEEIR